MTDSSTERASQLLSDVAALEEKSAAVGNMESSLRAAEIESIEAAMAKLQRKFDILDKEMILAGSKAGWKSDSKKIKQQFKDIKKNLKWAATASEAPENKNSEEAVVAYGDELIVDINKRSRNVIGMIDQAEKAGTGAANKLKTQGDQLSNVDKDLHEIDSSLNHSSGIIKRLARGVW
jgi:uncharacterized membrane protein YgaE (UPF0421/DUF939 family)